MHKTRCWSALVLVVMMLCPVIVQAQSVKIGGVPSFTIFGNRASIYIPVLTNTGPGIISSISAELWAFDSPYNGMSAFGYRLASGQVTTLGFLGGYQSLNNVNIGNLTFALPAVGGLKYFSIIITEQRVSSYYALAYWNSPDVMSCDSSICIEAPVLTVTTPENGLVTSAANGIVCPGQCEKPFANGKSLLLYAHPAAGYRFSGWRGACSGTGECRPTMTNSRSVTASFSRLPSGSENTVCPTTGLWAVDAEQNGQPGRGFTVEQQGGQLVLTVFNYEANGTATFHQAIGAAGGTSFLGQLDYYTGGSAFGGTWKSARLAGNAGQAAISFADANHGTITLPKEAPKAIRKMYWSAAAQVDTDPVAGLWAVDDEVDGQPGRGLTIEKQGDTAVVTVYAYDTAGKARFYQATGPLRNGHFSATLEQYKSGTTFGGSTRPASLDQTAGTIVLDFADATHAKVTLPGETAKNLSKVDWGGNTCSGGK